MSHNISCRLLRYHRQQMWWTIRRLIFLPTRQRPKRGMPRRRPRRLTIMPWGAEWRWIFSRLSSGTARQRRKMNLKPSIICSFPDKIECKSTGSASQLKNSISGNLRENICPEIKIVFFPPMYIIITTSIIIDSVSGIKIIFQVKKRRIYFLDAEISCKISSFFREI